MFFKLTAQGWTDLYSQLTKSELGLLYYIRSLDPFGDREIDLNTSSIAEKLSISIRTVQRALSSLKQKGLIVTKQIRSYIGGSKMSPCDDIVVEATRTDTLATQSDIEATQNVVLATPMSFSGSETTVQQASQKPETNKTKYKKKDSLSSLLETLPESEREKFLSFSRAEVAKLPNPPVFPDEVIARRFDTLYARYKEPASDVAQNNNIQSQFNEWYDLMCQLGHVTGQKVENGVQMVETHGGFWSTYEQKSQRWTLKYLRKCVRGR